MNPKRSTAVAEAVPPASTPEQTLQAGTLIDRYEIERHLANGGFSAVYLARRLSDQRRIAIKEYWPRRFAQRCENNHIKPIGPESRWSFIHGKRLFLEEAKTLIALKHPNIVRVQGFFIANSTAYLVMSYEYGKSLSACLQLEPLSEYLALTVFSALLNGVKHIHEHGLLHLDIKPGNVLLRPGGVPVLLDFGAARCYPKRNTRASAIIRTHGYSPIEQYSKTGNVGPWSDVYAVGATLRACIEGIRPPTATNRAKQDTLLPAAEVFKGQYTAALLKAIDYAMQVEASARPRSAQELLRMIGGCL